MKTRDAFLVAATISYHRKIVFLRLLRCRPTEDFVDKRSIEKAVYSLLHIVQVHEFRLCTC